MRKGSSELNATAVMFRRQPSVLGMLSGFCVGSSMVPCCACFGCLHHGRREPCQMLLLYAVVNTHQGSSKAWLRVPGVAFCYLICYL